MNCDVVAASPSAELFAGLPVSSFASGWFLSIFIISLLALKKDWEREAVRMVFGFYAVGLLFCFTYFFIMQFKLKTFCLYCMGVDLCTLLGAGISLNLRPDLPSRLAIDRKKWKVFFGIGTSSQIIMVFGLSFLNQNAFQPQKVQEEAKAILKAPILHIDLDDDMPSVGPKRAPITIVEFSDFQCPFCKTGALNVNSLLYHYPEKIRIIFKNYPLDQKCNPDFPQTMHPAACEAAKVALCAHQQGKFETAYEILFENQSSLVEGTVSQLMKASGIDAARLSQCQESPQTDSQIARDISEGKTLGINGTPTFFINGHKVEGIRPIPVWNAVIETLLKKP
jgi:protein-disulfide isomerase